jgi:hypothetical protein
MAKKAADPIDDLYGVDPEEFVSARAALAKRLRADGDREGAAAIKKLAKPTRAAWAVNRLVRDRPEEIRALVDAGEALAGAQEQLLEGADASVLRGAAEAARRLVDALADEAPVEGAARDKVRGTLHAATVDEDVRRDVAAGRVVRERSASGFGGLEALLASGFAAKDTPARKAKGRTRTAKGEADGKGAPAKARPEPKKPAPKKPDPREVLRRRDALRRAKEAEARAEDGVTGAQRSLDQVESTVAARRRELEEARSSLSDARDRRERAERAAAETAPPS